MDLIGLDFETYGSVNLPAHGLDRYTSDPHFRPLIACAYWIELGRPMQHCFDFVEDFAVARFDLDKLLAGPNVKVAAHNAPFEKAVLDHLGIKLGHHQFIDSAVVARAAGAGSRLEAAAPQLLGVDKMEEGRDLIKLFSIPGKYQERSGSPSFDPDVVREHPDEWRLFGKYCMLDATLSRRIVEGYTDEYLTYIERQFQELTMRMNEVGWPVDVDSVEEMQRRYLENQDVAVADFRQRIGGEELNLNSLPQLKDWCAKRGIRASSFDEMHVERLLARVEKKINSLDPLDPKVEGYAEVRHLLRTKQILGGSSLKKLQVILDRVGADGRLRDQYLHAGAGQSMRTTGTGVQMQNLPRLGEIRDMDTLPDVASEWSNADLADNLRQVFWSSKPGGHLIVGDFSSVESRGLAWLAGEEWKLDAYRKGLDMYKVGAAKQFGVDYDQVNKEQRTFGKVGELGCGYQAGAGAVKDFAAKMGVELTEEDAARIVYDWRAANPVIVDLWDRLNTMLLRVVAGGERYQSFGLKDSFSLVLRAIDTPASLLAQHKDAQSIMLEVLDPQGLSFLRRVFHGCHRRGRNVGYYKPSDRKTGDLWKNHYTDPKTKQLRFYELYGGKVAGILTQSFCRELFFRCLLNLQHSLVDRYDNLTVIGQFHDEIVVDWVPNDPAFRSYLNLETAVEQMESIMSDPGIVASFPLAAEVKSAHRYIK